MVFVCAAVWIFLIALLLRIVFSWFPNGTPDALQGPLSLMTDWALLPLRKVIPPVRVGGGYLEISSLVLIFVIQLIVLPIVC